MSQAKPKPTFFSGKFKQLQPDGTTKSTTVRHMEYKDKNMSIKEIEKLAIDIRKNFIAKDKGAQIQLVIETPFGDRSGKYHRGGTFRNIKESEIHVWNPTLYTYDSSADKNDKRIKWYNDGKAIPKTFWFNVIYTDKKGGADDKHNDCLYNCLLELLQEKFTKIWETPAKFKNYLGVKRNDMISIEHIDKLENRIKVQICITGDETRIPTINSKTKINLILQNSHYKILPSSEKPAVKGVSWHERRPITCHYNKDTNDYTLYDGKGKYTVSKEKQWEMGSITSQTLLLKVADKDKLKIEYDTFVDQADKFKVETNGLINFYKTGTIKATALQLFYDTTKTVEQADTIQGIEGEWILDCYRGAIMDATLYEGKAWKHDVSSMYPSIMAGKTAFAYKAGELLKITDNDMKQWIDEKSGKQYFKYGMYRAVITGDIHKVMFRQNSLHRYTHLDLETAYKEGYSINLIEDGRCNFYYYPPNTTISGTQLFKKYVDVLYPIKKKHNDKIPELNFSYVKPLLSYLWGALSQKKIYNEIYTGMYDDKEVRPLDVNEQISNTVFLGNGRKMYETEKTDDYFMTGFARISPFITAKGRQMMANLIRDNIDVDCCVRIHTDGIITSKPLKNTFPNKKDAKLGELGYEGYCNHCVVKNMATPIGDFKI